MSYNPDDHTDSRRTAEALERIADVAERALEIMEEWARPRAYITPAPRVSDALDAEEHDPSAPWNIAGVDR